MSYEPSKELIEQIAEEVYELNKCNLGWEDEIDFVKHHKLSFQNAKNYYKLPTFNKALELYENQPKWQDKPDKEGWWWVCSEEPTSGAKFNRIVEIRGIPAGLRVWVGGFPTIEQYIGEYVRETKITWLHIPEPESYKGE